MVDALLRAMTGPRRVVIAVAAGLVVAALIGVLLIQELSATRGASRGSSLPPVSHANQVTIGFRALSRPAPAFSLPWLHGGGQVTPKALAGKPIVVNFWASTCTVCKKESPAIAKVAAAARGRVRFLGIDTADSRSAGEAFARRYHMTYPLAFDAPGLTAASYGVPGLPVTFFLSPTGKQIVGVNIGALTGPGLTSILHRLYGAAA
jgi:cytochrome c biogenesis protein CcmG/thiol:disulfide interchange protein DsbE